MTFLWPEERFQEVADHEQNLKTLKKLILWVGEVYMIR
jgi:hypothetical protein